MKLLSFAPWICALVVALSRTTSEAAVSLASGYWEENFDSPLSSEWQLTGLGLAGVPSEGYSSGLMSGTGNGRIVAPSNGTAPTLPAERVAPIVTARSYSEFGFGGSWLLNTTASSGVRSATITFDNLAVHTGVNLSFLIGVADSLDTGEGIVELKLDGEVIFRRDADAGGFRDQSAVTGAPNVGGSELLTTHVKNANLTNYYQEKWNNHPSGPNDRFAQNWTLDGAYTFDGLFAHTASTMTLEWSILSLDQTAADEFISIDRLRVQLVPEPSRAVLLMLGAGLLAFRRRRA